MLGNKIMELTNIEITMDREQLVAYRKGDLSTLNIYIDNNKETFEELEKWIVLGLGVSLYVSAKYIESFTIYGPAVSCMGGLDGIDRLGARFLSILRKAGYWLILIRGIADVIKEANKGGETLQGIAKVVITYVLLYASLFLLPECFNLVQECFN